MRQPLKRFSKLTSYFLFFFSSFSIFAKDPELRAGGDLTIYSTAPSVFRQPAPGLEEGMLQEFLNGRQIFDAIWKTNSESPRNGLGPLFNANSCFACHVRDGRGLPHSKSFSEAPEAPTSLQILFKIQNQATQKAHPQYGSQFQTFDSGMGVRAEGKVKIRYERKDIVFGDGTRREIRKPIYALEDLEYGELDLREYSFSPRISPANFGLGLLEAISEQDILALADPEDRNQDGISGRAARGWNRAFRRWELGRFGWRADQPSIRQQNAAALHHDIGIRNRLFQYEDCGIEQKNCTDFDKAQSADFEISDMELSQLTLYVHLLGVPAARTKTSQQKKGREIFSKIGCASCHRPSFVTSDQYEGLPILMNQRIYPYTDLLLHDMGPGLADQTDQPNEKNQEWRTPPLWGIGLYENVNGHSYLLHDGRARNLEEAILWHEGESENSRDQYTNLTLKDREALIEFLKSL